MAEIRPFYAVGSWRIAFWQLILILVLVGISSDLLADTLQPVQLPPDASPMDFRSALSPESISLLTSLRPQFEALNAVLEQRETAPPLQTLQSLQTVLERWPRFYPPIIHFVEQAEAQNWLDQAHSYFQSAVTHAPADPRGWFGLARVFLKRGELTAALDASQKALSAGCPYWGCFSDAGRIYAQLGRMEEGIRYLETFTSSRYPPERQGLTWLALSRLEAAVPGRTPPHEALERAVALLRPGHGYEAAQYFRALSLSARGLSSEAFIAFQAALEVYRRLGDVSLVASLLLDLSEVQARQGLVEDAIGSLETALPLYERWRDLHRQALILQHLGELKNRAGRLEAAFTAYSEARRRWQSLADPQREAECLLGLVDVLGTLDRLPEAQETLDLLFSLLQKQPDKHLEGFAFHHQGRILNARGRPGEAIVAYRSALELRRALDLPAEVGMTLQNMADTYRRLGEVGLGREMLEEALLLHRQAGSTFWIGLTLGNLGDAWLAEGDVARALEHYRQAWEVHHGMGDSRWEGIVQVKLALASLASRPLTAPALSEADRALDLAWHLLHRVGDPVEEATALRVRGELRLAQGRFAEGLLALEEARQRYQAQGERWLEGVTLKLLARAKAREGNRGSALEHLEAGLRLQLGVQDELRDPSLQATYFSSFASDYAFAIRLLTPEHSDLLQNGISRELLDQTFHLAEQARAHSFHRWMQLARLDESRRAPQERQHQVQQLRLELNSIREQQSGPGRSRAEQERLEQRFQARSRELREALAALYDLAPTPPHLQPMALASLTQVQQALPADALLVAFLLDAEGSFAWQVTRHDARLLPIADEQDLTKEIEALLHALMDNQSPLADLEQRALGIFLRLFPQGADWLHTHPRLIVVPDGILGRLPFEVLVERPGSTAGSDPPWLFHSHSISYAPSVSAWLASSPLSSRIPAQGALLALGDPVYHIDRCMHGTPQVSVSGPDTRTGRQNDGWSRLCASREEILQVQRSRRRWGRSASSDRYLLGVDATEARFRAEGPARFSLLHFSTHGQVFPADPGRSALVLGQNLQARDPENPRGFPLDDGYLDLRDILELNLQVELVVLSACETAVGRQRKGEGVESLARGLLLGGAHRVVASLWAVDDRATAEFMGQLYREMRHHPLDQALQRVRTRVVRRPSLAHPYYWAPFILVMGGHPLESPEPQSPR